MTADPLAWALAVAAVAVVTYGWGRFLEWGRDTRGGDRCPDHAVPGGAMAPPPAAG